jgi:hypothetical protein
MSLELLCNIWEQNGNANNLSTPYVQPGKGET